MLPWNKHQNSCRQKAQTSGKLDVPLPSALMGAPHPSAVSQERKKKLLIFTNVKFSRVACQVVTSASSETSYLQKYKLFQTKLTLVQEHSRFSAWSHSAEFWGHSHKMSGTCKTRMRSSQGIKIMNLPYFKWKLKLRLIHREKSLTCCKNASTKQRLLFHSRHLSHGGPCHSDLSVLLTDSDTATGRGRGRRKTSSWSKFAKARG